VADAVAIVGVGESDYSWESGETELGLALAAIRAALADAGLEPREVDGLLRFSIDTAQQHELAPVLDIPKLRLSMDAAHGAASAVSMLAAASAAIRAGDARVVVCYRAFNGRSRLRLGHFPMPAVTPEGHILAEGPLPIGGEFAGPYGSLAPGCMFALWTRAYMDRHGISDERMSHALGTLCVRQRGYAARNPRALLRDKPLDRDAYLASKMIADPLRKPDFCLETDGACAVVVAGAGVIRRIKKRRPVYLAATHQDLTPDYFNLFTGFDELPPRLDPKLPEILGRLGLDHDDVDVLGNYDACSANTVFDVETLGFCAPGEGIDYVEAPGAAINTSGGLLSEVYLQGMNQLAEVVRQMRGDSPNQVAGAGIGVLSVAGCQGVAVLAAEAMP
jgi:acetyl-CoA acetyltransferase